MVPFKVTNNICHPSNIRKLTFVNVSYQETNESSQMTAITCQMYKFTDSCLMVVDTVTRIDYSYDKIHLFFHVIEKNFK